MASKSYAVIREEEREDIARRVTNLYVELRLKGGSLTLLDITRAIRGEAK